MKVYIVGVMNLGGELSVKNVFSSKIIAEEYAANLINEEGYRYCRENVDEDGDVVTESGHYDIQIDEREVHETSSVSSSWGKIDLFAEVI